MDLRSRGTWSLILLATVGACFIIERLIVTDAEEIESVLETAGEAVRHGDFATLAETIDEEYLQDGRNREEMLQYVESLWKRHRPRDVRVRVEKVEVNGDDATAKALLRARGMSGGPAAVRVAARLVRRGDSWRIQGAWLDSFVTFGTSFKEGGPGSR